MTGTDLHFSVSEMGDQDKIFFTCRKNDCPVKSTKFNRVLNHVWDKHSIEKNFSYKCRFSGCLTNFKNLQSFLRNCKKKHEWFFQSHMLYYKGNTMEIRTEVVNADSADSTSEESVIEPLDNSFRR